MATLKERSKLDIPKAIPVPYEELDEEGKRHVDRIRARTKEERERDSKQFIKWLDDLDAGKIDLHSSKLKDYLENNNTGKKKQED